MTQTAGQQTLEPLGVFVGEWSMVTSFAPNPAGAPRARTSFEWLPGRRFLIQRWEVEHPDAPDGIAIIGLDADKAALLRLAWRRARVRDDLRRQGLDAPTAGSRSRLLAGLHRHLRRRSQHDRRPLGEFQRRLNLEPRRRPHLHAPALEPRSVPPSSSQRWPSFRFEFWAGLTFTPATGCASIQDAGERRGARRRGIGPSPHSHPPTGLPPQILRVQCKPGPVIRQPGRHPPVPRRQDRRDAVMREGLARQARDQYPGWSACGYPARRAIIRQTRRDLWHVRQPGSPPGGSRTCRNVGK
jgi:hypothetical protein